MCLKNDALFRSVTLLPFCLKRNSLVESWTVVLGINGHAFLRENRTVRIATGIYISRTLFCLVLFMYHKVDCSEPSTMSS